MVEPINGKPTQVTIFLKKHKKNKHKNASETSAHSSISSSLQPSTHSKGHRQFKRRRQGNESYDESLHMESSPSQAGNGFHSSHHPNSDTSDVQTPASCSGSSLNTSSNMPTMPQLQSMPLETFLDQMRGHMQTHQKQTKTQSSKAHKTNQHQPR